VLWPFTAKPSPPTSPSSVLGATTTGALAVHSQTNTAREHDLSTRRSGHRCSGPSVGRTKPTSHTSTSSGPRAQPPVLWPLWSSI